MAQRFDVDAYFARVGWSGTPSPTMATLRSILQAHTRTIPFENLDVLLGRPIRLDREGLEHKLVAQRRGGYCFEHATLISAALQSIGFEIRCHSARVVLFSTRDQSPRTHMFLTVRLEGTDFVIDPGFGPYAAAIPLPLSDSNNAAKSATHRIARDGNHWVLHVRRGEEMIPGWVTTLEEDNPIDFELANHWTATHPASPFKSIMMLSAATPEGRVNVMNRNVTVLRGSEAETSQLSDRRALRSLLSEHFGFDLPEVEQMRVPAIPEW